MQYIITRLPLSSSRVSGALTQGAKSREFRILGSTSVAPVAGGWKWPTADSYLLWVT